MTEQNAKFITVIMPQGKGAALLQALYERKTIRASLGTARAPFFVTKKKRGLTRTIHHSVEKDILTMVVDAAEAEEIFAFVHEQSGMGTRYGGFMYMGPIAKSSSFTLPAEMRQGG